MSGLGFQKVGLIRPYFGSGCLRQAPSASHVPHLSHQRPFWGSWEDQFQQSHWNRFFSAVLLKRHQEAWAGVSFSLLPVPLQIRALREALKGPGLKDKVSTG